MTIIQRHARDLHAKDVITYDPYHKRDVRWYVTRPPTFAGGGTYALWDYVDLLTGAHGTAYFKAMTLLSVEPAGGAQ